MTALKIFKVYIVAYFLFASSAIYFLILTGIKIPIYIEIFPFMLLLLNPSVFKGLGSADLLFFLLLANSIIFFLINSDNLSWVGNLDVRGMILLSINYFIFRNLLKPKWSETIADVVIKILKYSMYLLLLEFIVINNNDIAGSIESRYLSIYPEAERLYENLVNFTRPFGLYPGTHNAAIASVISLTYLKATKSIRENVGYFVASLLVFFICFGLTSFITLLAVNMILIFREKLSVSFLVKTAPFIFFAGITIYYSLIFNLEISQIRSHGEITLGRFIDFEDYVYIQSMLDAFESIRNFPFGAPLDKIDLFRNEVFISRAIMYYGVPIIIFFIAAFMLIVSNLKHQGRSGLFFSIAYLVLFLSSFHYPSMIYYPLNILVPLAFVLISYGPKGSYMKSYRPATPLFPSNHNELN